MLTRTLLGLALGTLLPLAAAEPLMLDLSPVAVRALADPVANDGVGGWTDQGPERDLSGLNPGVLRFGGVPLRLDGGPRACIVLGPPERKVPPTATLRLPAGAGRHLYLLHALAWARGADRPGRIVALGGDGKELGAITVEAGKDVADWWGANDLPNGRVAARVAIDEAEVGLFLSHYELPAGAAALRLEATATAMWGVVAATVAEQAAELPPLPAPQPTAVAGQGWQPITAEREVVAGSAADLSFLLDAPAGKHGFASPAPDGHLRFADGTRARFAGSNLSLVAGDILTRHPPERMAELAERWARLGDNVCRLLYIDGHAIRDTADGIALHDERMARLDLLAAEMKKRGVYLTIDLMWYRVARHGLATHCPEFYARHKDDAKALKTFYVGALNFIPALRDDWEAAARLILDHVNPHTGLAWKDDPQVVAIGVANEDNLDHFYQRVPELKELARRAYLDHLRARYRDDAGLTAAWGALRAGESLDRGTIELPGSVGGGVREADLFDCLAAAQTASYRDMAARLRRMGCKQALSATNMVSNAFTAAVRRPHDVVDNHAYWDHPRFPVKEWSLPYGFHGRALMGVKQGWRENPAAFMATSRHFGKPMMVTEYDHTFPNPGRSDAGLVAGAMAAFQDWDLFTSFNYSFRSDDLFDPMTIRNFDKVADPLAMAVERQMRLLFLRGDVRPAAGRLALRADPAQLARADVSEDARLLACMTGVGWDFTGSATGAALAMTPGVAGAPLIARNGDRKAGAGAWVAALKGGVLPAGNASDGAAGRLVSDTGEVTWDHGAGRLLVDTPRTQGAAVTAPGAVALSGLTAEIAQGPATLSVSSLDGRPLNDCTRALAVFATDVVNSGMLVDERRRRLHSLGTLPLLVRQGSASVVLEAPRLRRAWAIDTAGRRLAEIPLVREGDKVRFELATARGGVASLMAELGE